MYTAGDDEIPTNLKTQTTRWTRGAGPAVGITVSAQFSGIILWLKCSMIFSSIFWWFLEISIFSEKFRDFFSTKLFTHLQNALRVAPRVLISWQMMFLSIENVSGVPDRSSFPPVGTNRCAHAQRDIIDFGTSRWLKTGQRPGLKMEKG